MHVDLKTALAMIAPAAALLALAACGGGGSATTTGGGQGPTITMPTEPTEPTGPTVLPPARAETAGLAPLIQLEGLHEGELRVGVVRPPAGLAIAGVHGQATVRHGRLDDGLGGAHLSAYLVHDVTEAPQAQGRVLRFGTAPVVRYREGTSDAHVDLHDTRLHGIPRQRGPGAHSTRVFPKAHSGRAMRRSR